MDWEVVSDAHRFSVEDLRRREREVLKLMYFEVILIRSHLEILNGCNSLVSLLHIYEVGVSGAYISRINNGFLHQVFSWIEYKKGRRRLL